MRTSRLWATMLGCENTVIEGVDWHEGNTGQLAVTVHVRPGKRLAGRCPACGKKRPGYDQGQGRRRWRALDLGTVRAELEAAAPRVACPRHGVVTAAVPWARHGAAIWPARWAVTNSTKASGQPNGQSIPVLAACSIAPRITSSSAGQMTSWMTALVRDHPIVTSAVPFGLAVRSIPAAITG